MNLDVVNSQNEKVGTLDLSDEVFGGRIKDHLVWESVVHANAAERRGTHMTKNRALVSGTGKKPWRQKGTGRARVGETRNPLWRKGGTVFGPQPRSYDYAVPKKVERGALRAALSAKLRDQAVIVVDQLSSETVKTKAAVEMLRRLGVDGKALLVDLKLDEKLALAAKLRDQAVVVVDQLSAETVKTKAAVEMLERLGVGGKALLVDLKLDEKLALAVRNIDGVRAVESGRLTARDLAGGGRIVVTRAALERLQEVLG